MSKAVDDALRAKREEMKAACGGIGEPCVELPLSEIRTYKDDNGDLHAIIGMDQLSYFVANLLRNYP